MLGNHGKQNSCSWLLNGDKILCQEVTIVLQQSHESSAFQKCCCGNYTPQPMNNTRSYFHMKMYLKIARNFFKWDGIYGRHFSEHISNLIFKKHKWRQSFWEYLITNPKEIHLHRKPENILLFQRWLTPHLYFTTCYSSSPSNNIFRKQDYVRDS